MPLRAIFVNSPILRMSIYTPRQTLCSVLNIVVDMFVHNILYIEKNRKRECDCERHHSCETLDANSPVWLMHSVRRVL